MFKSTHERKIRYSIRKFSVGVASIAVASLFLGQTVQATEAQVGNKPVVAVTTEEQKVDYPTMEQSQKVTEVGTGVQTTETKETTRDIKEAGASSTTKPLTEEQLRMTREGMKKSLDETDLPQDKKEEYKKKIDQETDFTKLQELENDFSDENRQLLEEKEKKGAIQQTLTAIDQELNQQNYTINKMYEKKGLTLEDKEALMKQIEKIREKAYKEVKEGKSLDEVKKEVLVELGKLFQSFKATTEKEIQDYVNQKVDEKVKENGLDPQKAGEDADVKQLRELEKKALAELDKATKNEEVSTAKTKLIAEIANIKSSDKSDQGMAKPRVRRDSPENKENKPSAPEAKPQTPTEETQKLESLVKQAQEELKKLEQTLADVDKYPELPENNADYSMQRYIWNGSKDFDGSKKVAPDKMKEFREKIEKHTYTAETLQKFIDDFIYYQIHAKIELMTRQVAVYRGKYPNTPSLEKAFESGVKQTNSNSYATQEGEALKNYFETEFLSAFNKIQQIVAIKEAINKLEEEMKTVPDGAKLTGEAGEAYNGTRTVAKEAVEEGNKLLSQEDVTKERLATQLNKLNDALSKLKVAKEKLVPKAEDKKPSAPETPKPEAPKDDKKPSVPEAPKPEAPKDDKKPSVPETPKPETPKDDKKPSVPEKPKAETPKDDKKPSIPEKPKAETPKEDKKPSVPETPKPEAPKDDKKPSVPTPEKPQPSKIFTATDGKSKITVVFDKSVDANKVNFKEVTSKALVDKVTSQTGQGTVRVFDISLSKDGKKAAVAGERTVRLAIGQTGTMVQVYHIKENGELELIPSKVVDGHVVFKTSHFSLFAVKTMPIANGGHQAGAGSQSNNNQKSDKDSGSSDGNPSSQNIKHDSRRQQNQQQMTTSNKAKKSLPSTGTAASLGLEIIGLLTLAGAALFAKKRIK